MTKEIKTVNIEFSSDEANVLVGILDKSFYEHGLIHGQNCGYFIEKINKSFADEAKQVKSEV